MKQPLFNSTHKSFTRRDTLGLQNISSSIQASVCPIINVVTPHPFYWAYLIWNYYHFYSNPENKNATDDEFNRDFIKRNDFFFVLCNYLGGNDLSGIAGQSNVAALYRDKNYEGPFVYDISYYRARFGGMQYYNFGTQTMGFVPPNRKDIDINGNSLGARLTRAFDSVIQNTAIYKNYISQNKKLDNLSKDELVELSQYLTFKMEGMDEVKELIYKSMFNVSEKTGTNSLLMSVEQYLKMLIEVGLIKDDVSFSGYEARRVLYGDKYPLILDKRNLTELEKRNITRWELVIANQYYVATLEMMWKYMLSILSIPSTLEEWIDNAIESSKNLDLEAPLSSIQSDLSFDEIEKSINNDSNENTLYSSLSVLMTIYNRFKGGRISDFDAIPFKEQKEFCVFTLIRKISNGQFVTVGDLLLYLLKDNIIIRHEVIATEKQYYGRDGFLYEKVYDRYLNRGSDYTIGVDIPSLRITNVLSVLRDLGKL